ncbi:MAG: radical SAM protein [Oscillospiraceae bacterium]|nr:radical SAM protein [Oscillospiraceae bacterium]
MKHSNISIFIPHNGCPNQCSFCNQRTISGAQKQPSAEDVTELLKNACPVLSTPKNTEIAFFGGSFTAIDRSYMISLLEAAKPFLTEYGLIGIRISTRPDKIDGEVLDILERYGVTSIELGAQSMRDEVLAANDRGHSAEDVKRASRMIKERGFELGLQMMTGLYKSSPDDDRFTAEEIIALAPETVRIYPVVILGGTKLADLYQSGVYKTIPFEEEAELCAELLQKFENAGIRVIRMGLHASESVGSEAVGGYYHPAFREVCTGILFRRAMEERLTEKGSYEIYVAPRSVSAANGHKKSNVLFFENRGVKIKIRPDESISGDMEMRIAKR